MPNRSLALIEAIRDPRCTEADRKFLRETEYKRLRKVLLSFPPSQGLDELQDGFDFLMYRVNELEGHRSESQKLHEINKLFKDLDPALLKRLKDITGR